MITAAGRQDGGTLELDIISIDVKEHSSFALIPAGARIQSWWLGLVQAPCFCQKFQIIEPSPASCGDRQRSSYLVTDPPGRNPYRRCSLM